MRIPEELKKCVVYLGNEESIDGVNQIKYRGTGFFVAVPFEKIPDSHFLYLVTAKHVADKLLHKNFYVSVNTKTGKAANLKCEIDHQWHIHPTDNAADVAIMPVGLDPNVFDYKTIPNTMFLDEKTRVQKELGAGDSVYITGLFVHHRGLSKNIPIVRVGSIATVVEERIPTRDFGLMEAYLIEAHSIGGLSGSPVFIITRSIPTAEIYLLGLIHGHWRVDSETVTDEIEEDSGIKTKSNVGIAIATPASKILDILNSDEMMQLRKDHEDKLLLKNSPTSDKP